MSADGLARLRTARGAFAMLALDQRDSLRSMLAAVGRSSRDADLCAFKVQAAAALSRYASAVLLDVAYGLGPVRDAGVLSPSAGLIVAADALEQSPGGPVRWAGVDEAVFDDDAIAAAADAYKLLIIVRPREAADRERVVRRFLDRCRERGRPGIVEGIVRGGDDGPLPPERHVDAVLDAAVELAELGPDIYKAEVPTLGRADGATITEAAGRVTAAIECPWVVLSNGTDPERFPDAAVAACRGGASGFLAGRAIWAPSLAADDVASHLASVAAPRLSALAGRVDEMTELRR